MLEKEIREDTQALRTSICLSRSRLGPMPFTRSDAKKWDDFQDGFKEKVKLIDGKIDKLNLIVPILNRQRVHVNLEREISKVLNEYGHSIWTNQSDSLEGSQSDKLGKEYDEFEKRMKLIVDQYFASIFKLTSYYGQRILEIFRTRYTDKN